MAGFQPGREKTGGRLPGVRNRSTRLLKEAILMAAELEGSDGNGKDGLIGFLRRIVKEDIRAFAMLLGRVLPLQIDTKSDQRETIVYRSVAEIRAEMVARGIDVEAVVRALQRTMDDDDDDDDDDLNVVRQIEPWR